MLQKERIRLVVAIFALAAAAFFSVILSTRKKGMPLGGWMFYEGLPVCLIGFGFIGVLVFLLTWMVK